MKKVNIREALLDMDKQTYCQYDLYTLYEACNLQECDKKEIAKMISDDKSPEDIYDKLVDKFSDSVTTTDDDDISDVKESFGDDLIDSQYLDDTSDGHWSWDYDDDELANIYGGDTKYDNHPDGLDIDESATDPRYYKMVEYNYDGDDISNYLGHVRVRTNSDKVALRAAEKYAMSKHPEDNPGHFKIVDDNYTNVDVIDSDGDYLTTLESVDESESDKTDTFVTPEGKELKSSHFVKLFKDAVKTGAWHKKFGKQGELTRVEIENANKRENRLRMQLAELFGYSQEEIDAIEEKALSEPITADYLEESQNTDLHEGNSIAEDTSDRTSTDFSWSKGWCDCGAKDVFPHMLFATDAGTVFREGPYGYRLRGEVFAENPNIFHAYVMKYTDNSDYASHGQGGKTVVGKENLDSLEAAKAFIEDWFTNSFDSYVKTKNESLNESKSIKQEYFVGDNESDTIQEAKSEVELAIRKEIRDALSCVASILQDSDNFSELARICNPRLVWYSKQRGKDTVEGTVYFKHIGASFDTDTVVNYINTHPEWNRYVEASRFDVRISATPSERAKGLSIVVSAKDGYATTSPDSNRSDMSIDSLAVKPDFNVIEGVSGTKLESKLYDCLLQVNDSLRGGQKLSANSAVNKAYMYFKDYADDEGWKYSSKTIKVLLQYLINTEFSWESPDHEVSGFYESKSIKESANTMIYLFPELTDEDLDMLKAYGLQLLGINYGAYGDEENWVVRGQEKALRRYADKYLGYELHPDYLYNENDFAGDIEPLKESITHSPLSTAGPIPYAVKLLYQMDRFITDVYDNEGWLMNGVPDGEFEETTPDEAMQNYTEHDWLVTDIDTNDFSVEDFTDFLNAFKSATSNKRDYDQVERQNIISEAEDLLDTVKMSNKESVNESKSIKESSLVDKKVSTLGKRGKPMYFTAAQLKDAKAKYPEYDFEEATIDKSLPQGQKAYIAKKKTNESKSIKEDRQSDILTIKSNIKDNLVLDNYMGTGKSHYQDYQIELFHDSDNYGGYPWCYVISKDSNILTKKCYGDDLGNTLYSVAQFIYNTESKVIKEGMTPSQSTLDDCLQDYRANAFGFDGVEDYVETNYPSHPQEFKDAVITYLKKRNEAIDGWDNRTGVIKRIDKYLYDNPEAIPPKGYIQPGSRASGLS